MEWLCLNCRGGGGRAWVCPVISGPTNFLPCLCGVRQGNSRYDGRYGSRVPDVWNVPEAGVLVSRRCIFRLTPHLPHCAGYALGECTARGAGAFVLMIVREGQVERGRVSGNATRRGTRLWHASC